MQLPIGAENKHVLASYYTLYIHSCFFNLFVHLFEPCWLRRAL